MGEMEFLGPPGQRKRIGASFSYTVENRSNPTFLDSLFHPCEKEISRKGKSTMLSEPSWDVMPGRMC